jgi:hypothetical protein
MGNYDKKTSGLQMKQKPNRMLGSRDFIFNLVTVIESADEICGIPAPYLVELKGTWESFFHFEEP